MLLVSSHSNLTKRNAQHTITRRAIRVNTCVHTEYRGNVWGFIGMAERVGFEPANPKEFPLLLVNRKHICRQ